MTLTKKFARLRLLNRLGPAVVAGLILCFATYGLDFLMDRMGTNASKTILNDVGIGLLGCLVVYFYLSAVREKQNFESARERILLIGEINLRIREALVVVASSAMSEDRWARIRGIDEATARIDVILSDFKAELEADGVPHSKWPSPSDSPGSPSFPADS